MFGFLRFCFQGGEKISRREIRVSISELSQIWLPYNQSFLLPEKDSKSVKELEGGAQPTEGFFSQSLIQEFYDPYRLYFENQGAREGFIALLQFLDKVRDFPSVRGGKEGGDSQFFGFGELLSKVSLGEHSVDVARIMLNLLRETYRDYKNLIPKALVSSLGHDIGKAPVVSESGAYGKADHPILSAQKVEELFSEREPSWLKSALDSIKWHHSPKISDQFTSLLKTADLRARAMEVASRNRELKVKEWDEWFNLKEFLEVLLPEINVLQTGNKWKAFSLGSVVYFQTEYLYESLRTLARKKGVIDVRLLRVMEKQEALKRIAETLRKERLLSDEIREPYWGRYFEVRTQKYHKKMFLVPIKIEAFEVLPHVIEERKEGYLREIEGVVPMGGGE